MLSELDVKILRELCIDGRLSLRKLAEKLRVPIATIAKHVKKLENDGVIKGYTLRLDFDKLGYELTAVIEVTVSGGKLLDVERIIAKNPCVQAVYDVTGEVDVYVIAKFRSRDELSSFVKSLLSTPYVERTNTHIVLTTIKEDFTAPILRSSLNLR
jgi:DNA-binding Lrp family transcriptional regulator